VKQKWQFFALTMTAIVVADLVTKAMAVRYLRFGETRVLAGLVPLTLTFNRGAAFSISVGEASRWFFLVTSLLALAAILVFYHRTDPLHRMQRLALALISSGAVGNLIDRIRWEHGVVDFIGPINLGVMFWPVFNVADSAITCGALLLALALWRSDRAPAVESATLTDS
jgi:signal peptidase II